MKRHLCLVVSLLPILLAYSLPVFGHLSPSDKESIKHFDAQINGSKVTVNWEIAGQIETPTAIDYYVVERRQASQNYMAIGGLNETDGASGVREYSFSDENLPEEKLIQYRLKLVFSDGEVVYSEAESIYRQGGPALIVAPNPFQDKVTLYLPSDKGSTYLIQIYNYQGELVLNQLHEGLSGEAKQVELDVTTLESGPYILNLISGINNWQTKLLKK